MNNKKMTVTLGVIFGLYLIAFAVFCFAISIVMAVAKDIDLTFTMFVFPVLGVATIIGACVVKKSIIATRVIYTISTAAYVGTLIFLAVMGLFVEITWLLVIFVAFAILGVVTTVIAYHTQAYRGIDVK